MLAIVIVAGFFPRTVRSAPREPVLRANVLSMPNLSGVTEPSRPPVVEPPEPMTLTVGRDDDLQSLVDSKIEPDRSEGERDEPPPIFYTYAVQTGDTLTGIAARFGIRVQYILWNNIDILPDADVLTPGQTLQIPGVEGIIHHVRLGETLIEIAELYDADVDDIVNYEANNLSNADTLREGSTILVVGGRIVARPTLSPPPPTTSSTYGFIWPTPGPITSSFGPAHPLGIDIGIETGTPVIAAAAGQVTFVGGHVCCSYGKYVIIKHDQTLETRYAHLSRFNVQLGQWVQQGDLIGWSGSTGLSTGPHLHFEIRRNGTPQDPVGLLPRR